MVQPRCNLLRPRSNGVQPSSKLVQSRSDLLPTRCNLVPPRFVRILTKKIRISMKRHDLFHSRCSLRTDFPTRIFFKYGENSRVEFWHHPTCRNFRISFKSQEGQKCGKGPQNKTFGGSFSGKKAPKCGRVAPK